MRHADLTLFTAYTKEKNRQKRGHIYMKASLEKEIEELKKWDASDRAEIETDGTGIIYRDACVFDRKGDATAEKIRIITEHGEAAGYLVLLNAFYEDDRRKDIKHFFMENDTEARDALLTYEKTLPKKYGDEFTDDHYAFFMKGYMTTGNTDVFARDLLKMADCATYHKKAVMLYPESGSDLTPGMMKYENREIKPILITDTEKADSKTFILAELDK